jgi:hypothetical protein
VTAQLLDAAGGVLARFNSVQGIAHKLRPGETTGFRIDFEGIAGATDRTDPTAGDFRPDAFTPLELDGTVAGIDVYAKAVVTGRGLDRPLTIDQIDMSPTPGGGLVVSGRLLNDGIDTATVPRVLVTGYGASGEVAWVEHRYLADSIAIGHDGVFTVELPPPPVPLGFGPRLFVNGVPAGETSHRATTFAAPQGSGYSAVAVSALAFSREAT